MFFHLESLACRSHERNCIRLTVVTNGAFAGPPKVVLIGGKAVHGELKVVAQKIAAISEIRCVIIMLGRYDIPAIGLFVPAARVRQRTPARVPPGTSPPRMCR
jgi:hypothetical protein